MHRDDELKKIPAIAHSSDNSGILSEKFSLKVFYQLFYIQDQTLEVLPFRMVNIHRMVARLGKLVKDAHTTSALGSCSKDSIAEVLLVHHLRAREGKEDTTRLNLLECLGIELAISAEGITQGIAVLGKRWRVEDDQVVLVAHTVEVLERIFGISLVTLIAREGEYLKGLVLYVE